MADSAKHDICARIAQLRLEKAGPRGKAAFARQLGLSPSTYDYYESSRVPPADVLVRIVDLTEVDLRWLLSGRESAQPQPSHPAIRRVAKLLARRPASAAALEAFLDLLERSAEFPAKGDVRPELGPQGQAGQEQEPFAPKLKTRSRPAKPATEKGAPGSPAAAPVERAGWIPVLGRSAAGIPHFWSSPGEAAGLVQLGDLVAGHLRRLGDRRHIALAASLTDPQNQQEVALVTLSSPGKDEVVEFIDMPRLKAQFPDAFALRIDGNSMHPDIRHADLVVLSPSAPAADGKPAVVQLAGQIGVTCKLFRRQGQQVHLVALSEELSPQIFPAGQVAWALRVLCRVRPR
jgi:transcriptional regulator with XRE-family HTH domain